jgi:hypothetical protein
MSDRWWNNDIRERYWCEITNRDEIGKDLYCPQFNVAGKPFWSYSLINEIQPGDIVFHYYSPRRAIIGASVATSTLKNGSIDWIPHWTGEARKAHKSVPTRPAWIRLLSGYTPLPEPLTLDEIQSSQELVRKTIADLEASGLAPMTFLQMYPGKLMALQGGYVTKMPARLVDHFHKLDSAVRALGSGKILLEDRNAAESLIASILDEIESKSDPLSGQGFLLDPAVRKAIEKEAVKRAKIYFSSVCVRGSTRLTMS